MNKLIAFFIFSSAYFVSAQTPAQIDSMSTIFCDYLHENPERLDDADLINELQAKKVMPYLQSLDRKKVEKTNEVLFYRLQRNCPLFLDMLDRLNPPAEAGEKLTEKPVSKMTPEEIAAFKNQKKFKYFEANGAVTKVIMDKGKWTDFFTDKTKSKLTFEWLNETEFQLTFIESNNETRSGFSFKGDKINYQVLSKESDHYVMTVNIPGQDRYQEFKLYVD